MYANIQSFLQKVCLGLMYPVFVRLELVYIFKEVNDVKLDADKKVRLKKRFILWW